MAGERSIRFVSTDTTTSDDDQSIDALIGGVRWANTSTTPISYSFTDSASDYSYTPEGTFAGTLSLVQRDAAKEALANFAAVANLSFTELPLGSSNGTLRFAEFSGVSTAYGYYPNSSESGGDMAFNTTDFNTPELGSYAYATFLHEIGHAMGLKHGHETDGPGAMRSYENSMEYSVMTYNSFAGQSSDLDFYTNKSGHFAQTLMVYDIAALQRLYGADYSTNNTDSTYTFSKTTGEMFINGAGQGAPTQNVIFRTVWDGGGIDTYDLSNYTNRIQIDLRPGKASRFDINDEDQLAILNEGYDSSGTFVGVAEKKFANGHLYNALQFDGNAASLIENAVGGTKSDVIYGNDGSNTIWGGAGNDFLLSQAGDDTLFGGSGDDKFRPGGGKETFYGGTGSDWIEYSYADYEIGEGITVDLETNSISGGAGEGDAIESIEKIRGTGYQDVIRGNSAENTLIGENGDDHIFGGDGDDLLEGGGDKDSLYGGSGADAVAGGRGDDYIRAGGGEDSFYGGDGHDYLSYHNSSGGITINLATNSVSGSWASNDLISGFESASGSNIGNDRMYGTSDANTLRGKGGDDKLYGGAGSDKLYGGAGDDYIRAGGGAEKFYGGSGTDYISYYDSTNGITINLATNEVSGSWASNDTISGFESVGGSKTGDDKFYGTSGANRFKGYGGGDKFYGGDGNDLIYGSSGNDYARAGIGAQSFYGGSGSDDYISYYGSTSGVEIDLRDDTISGGWGDDDLIHNFESAGGSGTGNDRMLGTNGANRLKSYGGDDKLYGRSGNDALFGGSGKDRFDGGHGDDTLYGGSGDDIFHFDATEDADIIKDFDNNNDTIQFDNFSYLTDAASALSYATESSGNVFFDFGSDGTLLVENTSKVALLNDIEIV